MEPREIEIRRLRSDEYPHAALLRWQWTVGEMRHRSPIDVDAFVAEFTQWALAHEQTHTAFMAFRDEQPIGMCWVALAPRVPSPGSLIRTNAEVMSMYVEPDARNTGIGSRLIAAGVLWATEAGAEHAIVHSSAAAVGLYEKAGFTASPILLDQDLMSG
jgi:GNAT superfamily N-acetyltransferase